VNKGDIIAKLDDTTVLTAAESARRRLNVARAEAADVAAGINPRRFAVCERTLDKLREEARYCRSEAERIRKLLATSSASQQNYDAAQTKANQAEIAVLEQEAELLHLRAYVTSEKRMLSEAKVRLAEAELAGAEQRAADMRLCAPCDGVVLRYLKREGEVVSTLLPPEPIALFGDLSHLPLRAEIDERHVQKLTIGQTAEAYGRNLGGRVYGGTIIEVERAMGHKTVFTQAASERKGLHVLQVVIEMVEDFTAPIGLQVDVRIISQ